jgi:hypothetical protein
LQLQFGQSLQQSAEQQVPSALQVDGTVVEWLATLAATMPVASSKPLKSLTSIKLTFLDGRAAHGLACSWSGAEAGRLGYIEIETKNGL